jgi:hypothetical protein
VRAPQILSGVVRGVASMSTGVLKSVSGLIMNWTYLIIKINFKLFGTNLIQEQEGRALSWVGIYSWGVNVWGYWWSESGDMSRTGCVKLQVRVKDVGF